MNSYLLISLSPISQLSLKKPHDDNNVSCVIQNVIFFFHLLDAISLSGVKSKALTIDSDSELAKPNPNSVQLDLSISLCLVFLMHHTQSLTLFILQPVSFFLSTSSRLMAIITLVMLLSNSSLSSLCCV